MISRLSLLERARALGADKTLEDIDAALAKRDLATYVAAKKRRYRVELWDKNSPINGVPAEKILAERQDIPRSGEIYLIYIDGVLAYFQPHPPGEAGMRPMSREEALQIANDHVIALATTEAEAEIEREVLEELLQA